jgi:predicted nucleic acid-binding protein
MTAASTKFNTAFGKVFVDSSVLMRADDGVDAARQQAARDWLLALWQRRIGRLSTQMLSEYYVNVTRNIQPGLALGDARAKVRRFQQWQPWQIDHQTVETAWGIEARFGLGYRDSLIVAAAQHAGCRHVLSEAMDHEQQYGPIQIINPFLTPASQLDAPV